MAHRVVIVGGGFGGLYAAKTLRHADVEVTLIDRRNYHLFQPLLYQLATGSLSAGDISYPLRAIFTGDRHVKVVMAEVKDFDVEGRRVILTDGSVEYDTLIVATGSVTSYFGNDSWQETAVGMKTVEEALEIRRRVFTAFEKAERLCNVAERREWLTFVLVGAGPTGVELAGALSEIAKDTLKGDFRCIDPGESRIILLDGLDRALAAFPEDLSAAAAKSLKELGIDFRPKVKVTAVEPDQVTVTREDGSTEVIRSHTIIWAAGVQANPLGRILAQRAGAETTKGGLVHVEPDCTLKGHPEIFVIGDMAHFPHQPNGKGLPGVAPVAIQQGQYVGKTIVRRLKREPTPRFEYWNKGTLAVIGRNRGVADLGRFHFDGFLAWFMWLFIHLAYLVGFANRLLVMLQWGIQYLSMQRGARLITETGRSSPQGPKERPAEAVPAKRPTDEDKTQPTKPDDALVTR